jgi:hypothetical protein
LKLSTAIGAILGLATLIGCATATDTKAKGTAANATATAVSTSNIVGTWNRTATSTGSTTNSSGATVSTTDTETVSITVNTDGTWLTQFVYSETPQGGATVSSYEQNQGTWSLTGDQVTLTQTQTRYSSTGDFTSSVWGSDPVVRSGTVVLINGKLYESIWGGLAKAQGATSGLTGTWVQETYLSTSARPYQKEIFTLTPTSSSANWYYATKADYSDALIQPSNPVTYTVPEEGQMVVTYTSNGVTVSRTMFYLATGSYLAIDTDAACGGLTKQ